MSHLVRIGAGACAVALMLALGFAFWPQIDRSVASGRALVEKPVFVARANIKLGPAAAAAAAAAAATKPAPAADAHTGGAAIAKLAVALRVKGAATAPAPSDDDVTSVARAMAAPIPGALASDGARRLCAQGLVALAEGDIAGARGYLARAADAGDARALLALGETYDPAALTRMGARGMTGDLAVARLYYAKALAAGVGDARERMAAVATQ